MADSLIVGLVGSQNSEHEYLISGHGFKIKVVRIGSRQLGQVLRPEGGFEGGFEEGLEELEEEQFPILGKEFFYLAFY
jgi:hypothetical protein